jgi:DNA-binding response OmpR family regulator
MPARTILLIEDDEVLQEILEDFLRESGYHVLKAGDGLEGIDMIRKEAFDLILVDVVLPYVSGIGVIKMAKAKRADVPIICITGYGYSPEKLAEEEHADYILRKPFRFKNLAEAIENLLT